MVDGVELEMGVEVDGHHGVGYVSLSTQQQAPAKQPDSPRSSPPWARPARDNGGLDFLGTLCPLPAA